MSKIKNPKFFDIALATGGSHYPGVGGELLEKYGEMIVRECAKLANEETSLPYNSYSEKILKSFGLEENDIRNT